MLPALPRTPAAPKQPGCFAFDPIVQASGGREPPVHARTRAVGCVATHLPPPVAWTGLGGSPTSLYGPRRTRHARLNRSLRGLHRMSASKLVAMLLAIPAFVLAADPVTRPQPPAAGTRLDAYGDALPPNALHRFGTTRL